MTNGFHPPKGQVKPKESTKEGSKKMLRPAVKKSNGK